ncbi:MAG: hypothetical protein K8R58_10995 [Bacteroidales bacterium]|nr:hypothetical protein [Bacteroidales bacterium]
MKNNDKKYKPDEKENLKDLAPNLSKIEKINPFKVPDEYFDNLPTIIQEKINIKQQITLWDRFYQFILRPQYSIAVSLTFAAIVLVIYFTTRDNSNNDNSILANMTWEEILNENPNIINYFNESMLVEMLISKADNSDIDQSLKTDEAIINDTSISTDDMIEYLMEENYEMSEIYDL